MTAMPRAEPEKPRLPSRRGQRRNPTVDEQDRELLLGVAKGILEAEGAAGLSLRRLAKEVGTSYQPVYTLFGGKEGLLDALFCHGFEALEAACRAPAPATSPGDELVNLALAYRRFAHAHPELYSLMFGRDTRGFEPDAESRRVALRSFGVVRRAAGRVFQASAATRRHFGSADALARAAFSATHGHVVLELSSWFGPDADSEARLEETIRALSDADPPAPPR